MTRLVLKSIALVVAISLVVALLIAANLLLRSCSEKERWHRPRCACNLRQLGCVPVTDHVVSDGWPESSGSGFLLELCLEHQEVLQDLDVFRCPGDEGEASKSSSERRRLLFAGITREELRSGSWPEGLTSYAGRNQRDHPLPEDLDREEPIACDAAAHHPDGVNVLCANGRARFLTWEDLGIESAEEFGFRYGPKGIGGPGPLEVLCIRPR